MKHKTRIFATLFLACQASAAMAEAYWTSNPGSPYPPSCITVPLNQLDLTGDNVVMFFSERIWLEVALKIESNDPLANLGEVQLDMYRYGCAEPNRSVVIAEFTLPPEWVDPRKSQLVLPWLSGVTGFDPVPLTFKPEANSWGQPWSQFFLYKRTFGDYTGGWDDPRRFRWRYVVDMHPQGFSGGWSNAASYYNGFFGLSLERSNEEPFLTIGVPATEDLFEPAGSLPLSGRLSGNWIEAGSHDQGFVISFSDAPPAQSAGAPEDIDLTVFLSWFTYDPNGELLWLTGAAAFTQGASDVLVALERVEGGDFLGATPAGRTTVGSARLRAVECNRLELEFELGSLGLGADVMRLERLFAMEIADYPCRDFEAQYNSLYPPFFTVPGPSEPGL